MRVLRKSEKVDRPSGVKLHNTEVAFHEVNYQSVKSIIDTIEVSGHPDCYGMLYFVHIGLADTTHTFPLEPTVAFSSSSHFISDLRNSQLNFSS